MKHIKAAIVFSLGALLSTAPLVSSDEGIKGLTLTPAKTMIDFSKKGKQKSSGLVKSKKLGQLAKTKTKTQKGKVGKGQSNKQNMYGDIIMGGMPLDNFND